MRHFYISIEVLNQLKRKYISANYNHPDGLFSEEILDKIRRAIADSEGTDVGEIHIHSIFELDPD